MARSLVARKLAGMGGQPVLRQGFRTDNGNEILDVHNLKITDPVALEEKIALLVGVVEVGLVRAPRRGRVAGRRRRRGQEARRASEP